MCNNTDGTSDKPTLYRRKYKKIRARLGQDVVGSPAEKKKSRSRRRRKTNVTFAAYSIISRNRPRWAALSYHPFRSSTLRAVTTFAKYIIYVLLTVTRAIYCNLPCSCSAVESRRGAPHGEGYLATYTQTKRSSQNKQILVEYPSTHDRSSRDWWRYHQYILSCLCISKRSDRLRQVYRREDLLICNFHGHPRSGCLVEALVAGVDVVVARVQRALLLQL